MWLFPLFLHFLFNYIEGKYSVLKAGIYLTAVLAITALTSNYYGFFLLLFFPSFSVIYLFFKYLKTKAFDIKYLVLSILVPVFSLVLIFLSVRPFFKDAFNPDLNDPKVAMMHEKHERTLGDYYVFSAKPKYFFITPGNNPLYKMLGNPGAGLKPNVYFPKEHEAVFLGYLFLSFFIIVVLTAIKGDLFKKDQKKLAVLGSMVVLVVLMMPPVMGIFGKEVYGPALLLFKYVGVFRVSTRMIVLIQLLMLAYIGLSENVLKKHLKNNFKYVLIIVMVITLFETYIPIKFFRLENGEVYTEINSITEEGSRFAVYPYSRTKEAFVWLPNHRRSLVNVRDYLSANFESETFTKNLPTEEGIKELKNNDVDYLVVFKDAKDEMEFFLQSEKINLIKSSEKVNIFSVN
ncbi:hypothetical protein ACFL0C_00355 [Patescibacteria group bacterium]